MFTKSKVALSLALVVATASAAMAAPKHAGHSAKLRHVPATSYLSFGSIGGTARVAQPTYMTIQDIGFRESVGN